MKKSIFMNKLKIIFLLGLIFFINKGYSIADTSTDNSGCQVVYGGGESCPSQNLSVVKMVQKPDGTDYVKNLSINDPKFNPGQNVTFQITVKNNGTADINNIVVNDTFPQYMSFVSGPSNSTFNTNNNVLNFKISKLTPGQNQIFTIVGQTSADSSYPSDKTIICVTNQVQVTENSLNSQDSSQFCIQRENITPIPTSTVSYVTTTPTPQVMQTTTATTTPSTGAEMFAWLALIPGGISGVFIRKLSKKLILNQRG